MKPAGHSLFPTRKPPPLKPKKVVPLLILLFLFPWLLPPQQPVSPFSFSLVFFSSHLPFPAVDTDGQLSLSLSFSAPTDRLPCTPASFSFLLPSANKLPPPSLHNRVPPLRKKSRETPAFGTLDFQLLPQPKPVKKKRPNSSRHPPASPPKLSPLFSFGLNSGGHLNNNFFPLHRSPAASTDHQPNPVVAPTSPLSAFFPAPEGVSLLVGRFNFLWSITDRTGSPFISASSISSWDKVPAA